MATNSASSPNYCTYCGVRVGGERAYRRHLHDAHQPSELGPIDRHRYEQIRAEPSGIGRTVRDALDALKALKYPVDGETAVMYLVYGVTCSILVAALLGVGL